MFSKGNARSRSLCVVDEHIDAAEFFNGLIDDVLYGCGVVVASAHVCLDRKYLDAVETLELLFRIFELLDITPSDDQVCAFFCVCGSDAIADRSA